MQVHSVPEEQAAADAEQFFFLKASCPASVTAEAAVKKQSHLKRSKYAFV